MSENNILPLFIELSTANNHISKKLDRHLGAMHGLGVSEFRVLRELDLAPSQTLSRIDLAQNVGLTASGITRLLNPMEKIGLVEKQKNNRDARISLVKMNASGQERYQQALEGFIYVMESCLKGLDNKERQTLFNLLKKLS